MDKQQEILYKLGFALKLAQTFEHSLAVLVSVLSYLDDANVLGLSIDYQIAAMGLDKKTMGSLVRAVISHTKPPTEFENVLRDGLEARNFVAHAFFREHGLELHTKKGWNRADDSLRTCCERMKRAKEAVDGPLTHLLAQLGYDSAEAFEAFRAQVEREREV